jgi:hypothetical protein
MVQIVVVLVAVIGGYWLIKRFSSATPAQIKSFARMLPGSAVIILAGFLALRGGIEAAIPIFVMGAGLLGKQAVFPKGFPWNRKTPGQRSRVSTDLLSMELDHDTGDIVGEVLSGPLRGRTLSSLSDEELQSLHSLASGATDQSRALLESWLDRVKPQWRQNWSSGGGTRPSTDAAMSREEALAVLGLPSDASADDVRAAHRRLMKGFHPDHGGTDYIAAKINQAKDVLLQG